MSKIQIKKIFLKSRKMMKSQRNYDRKHRSPEESRLLKRFRRKKSLRFSNQTTKPMIKILIIGRFKYRCLGLRIQAKSTQLVQIPSCELRFLDNIYSVSIYQE